MSARGFWILALGAALALLLAFNAFRSEQPEVEPPAAQRPAEATTAQPADATVLERRDTAPQAQPQPQPQSGQAPVPASGPYASMSAALADHDAPPERRMPVLPEMLETDRTFAAESVDPAWSTATEAGVLRRIAEIPGAAYVSLNVDCRTTLCLLQFIESAASAPGSGIAEVTELVKPEGLKPLWTFGIRVGGGAPLGIAYLQRDDSTPDDATERLAR